VANEESVGTALVAGAANLGIAIAKAIAGVISGSSAMLSEAAHSFADTVTEALLFTALRRGDQPPTPRSPRFRCRPTRTARCRIPDPIRIRCPTRSRRR
jgi:hypothetical protein